MSDFARRPSDEARPTGPLHSVVLGPTPGIARRGVPIWASLLDSSTQFRHTYGELGGFVQPASFLLRVRVMPAGKVKKIVAEKGFGFIQPEGGGDDVFFHHSSLVGLQIEDLGLGDDVNYETEMGKEGKGPRAVNVTRVG